MDKIDQEKMKKALETCLETIESVYCGENSFCEDCRFYIEEVCVLGDIEDKIVSLPFIEIKEV